jgi:hypothetical protein
MSARRKKKMFWGEEHGWHIRLTISSYTMWDPHHLTTHLMACYGIALCMFNDDNKTIL